jgi:CHAT domain-containing protein/Flp pilus assembly protein TadD
MKNYLILFVLFAFLLHPSFSQKPYNYELEYNKLEKDYLKGDYKSGMNKSKALLKKVEDKYGADHLNKARILGLMAKFQEGSGKYSDYHSAIEQGLNILKASGQSDTINYLKAVKSLSEALIQYGDYKRAELILEEATGLINRGSISDKDLVNDIRYFQAMAFYHQGYLIKAEKIMEGVIAHRKSRVVKKEEYRDSRGKVRVKKLTKVEKSRRVRSAGDAMNLHSNIVIENGNYSKADSLFGVNIGYLKKYLGKKDVSVLPVFIQQGKVFDLNNKPFLANERYERAAKLLKKTKGIGYKSTAKPYMEIQEIRIISHRQNKRDSQAKKRKKVHETKILRSYGKNSPYYARVLLIEAETFLIQKEYKKAEERALLVINNPEYFPKNHPSRLKAYRILYNVYLRSDQFDKAEACLEQMSEIRKELHGEKAPSYHLAMLDLAGFQIQNSSKFKKAEEVYEQSMKAVENEIDHRHRNYFNYTYDYAYLFEYTDRFEKALEILNKAVDDSRKIYGENNPRYATSLEKAANVYIDLGKYAEAEKYLSIASEIFRKQSIGSEAESYSETLETYARLYIIQGQYDEARKMLKKAKNKQGGDASRLSGTIEELATLYIETGKYQETEKYLKEVLAIRETKYGKVHRSLVNPLNQLSHLYLITGNYTDSEKMAKRAAQISLQIFGEESIKFAESLRLLGKLYAAIGDYEKAEDATKKALGILKHQYGEKHVQVATLLNDYALIRYFNSGSGKEVEGLLNQALKISGEILGENHPRYAGILYNLGLFYFEKGDIEGAEKLLDRSNDIYIKKFGENNVHTAEIYFSKGNIAYKKANYVLAKAHYNASKTIYEKIFDNAHPGYLASLSRCGMMDYINGDYKSAVKSLDETTNSYLSFIKKHFPSLSEREKTKFWNKIQKDFEFYNTLAYRLQNENPELVGNVYNFALATKALLLNSSIKVRKRIMESNDATLIARFEEWVAKKEFLTSAISMTLEQRKENGIDIKVIETEIENLEKELSDKSEVFAKNFRKKESMTWRDVKKNLLDNEVAIEIVRFRYFNKGFSDSVFYAAVIISPQTKNNPEFVVLTNGKELEEKWLKYYRNSIKFNLEDKYSYEKFWEPIKKNIKDNVRIFLSPDGVYNQVNVETMVSKNKKYVIDENEIILVSNTRDLMERKIEKGKVVVSQNNKTNNRIALFGNPRYYSLKEEQLKDSTGFDTYIERGGGNDKKKKIPALPGAEKEVKDLHELLSASGWNSEAYLNEDATESKIKDLSNIRVFHIATHGFFLEEEENSSGLEGLSQNRAVLNPLMKSGLLLRDGGHLMDNDNAYEFNSFDGVLTAYEAMNLNFDNCDLVVLSACETGLGKVTQGEGVFGLQRAFLVAGAKSVVMSLFKVSDEVTQELMTIFYKKWIGGMDKRTAFMEAKKEIKNKYQKPIYWGAFVMVGLD